MPYQNSDIYVETTCILQKSADFDGQVCLNSAFATYFLCRFAATGGTVKTKITTCSLSCNQNEPQSHSSRSQMTLRLPLVPRIPVSRN